MKYTVLGAGSYGLQVLTVLASQALFFWFNASLSQTSSPSPFGLIQSLNELTNLFGIAALGGIAFTWLLMGYYMARKLFLVAGIATLASVTDYYALRALPSGAPAQLLATAAFGLITLITVLAFLSAARTYETRYLLFAGLFLAVSMSMRITYTIALYWGGLMDALTNPTLGTYVGPVLSMTSTMMPILVPLLACVGFIRLKVQAASQGT